MNRSMTKLTILEVQKNEIEGLPSTIENLTKLTKLDISSNKIRVLPTVLGVLPSLKVRDILRKDVDMSC